MPLPELVTETPLALASRCDIYAAFDVRVSGLDATDQASRVSIQLGQTGSGALFTLHDFNTEPAYQLWENWHAESNASNAQVIPRWGYLWQYVSDIYPYNPVTSWTSQTGGWWSPIAPYTEDTLQVNIGGGRVVEPLGVTWAFDDTSFHPLHWGETWQLGVDTPIPGQWGISYQAGLVSPRGIRGGWYTIAAAPLSGGPVWQLDQHGASAGGSWFDRVYDTFTAPLETTPPYYVNASQYAALGGPDPPNTAPPSSASLGPYFVGYRSALTGGRMLGSAITGLWQKHVLRYSCWQDANGLNESLLWSIDGTAIVNATHNAAEQAALSPLANVTTHQSGYVVPFGPWIGSDGVAAWPTHKLYLTVQSNRTLVDGLAAGYNLVSPSAVSVDLRDVVLSVNGIVRFFDDCRDGLVEFDLGDPAPSMTNGLALAGYEDTTGLHLRQHSVPILVGTGVSPGVRNYVLHDAFTTVTKSSLADVLQQSLSATSYGRRDPHGPVLHGPLGDEWLLPSVDFSAGAAQAFGAGGCRFFDRLQPGQDFTDPLFGFGSNIDIADGSPNGSPVSPTYLGALGRRQASSLHAHGHDIQWKDPAWTGSGGLIVGFLGVQSLLIAPDPYVPTTQTIVTSGDSLFDAWMVGYTLQVARKGDDIYGGPPYFYAWYVSGPVQAWPWQWFRPWPPGVPSSAPPVPLEELAWSYPFRYAQEGQVISGLPYPYPGFSGAEQTRLVGLTPDGQGCAITNYDSVEWLNAQGTGVPSYFADARLRVWAGKASTSVIEKWGTPNNLRLRSESAAGAWDPIQRALCVVGLQDRFASSGNVPLSLHLCWQDAPKRLDSGVEDFYSNGPDYTTFNPGGRTLLTDRGYTIADLAPPDTIIGGYALAAAAFGPSGALWIALWRVNLDTSLDLLGYRVANGGLPSAAELAFTVTGVPRPTFLTGRFLTDPVSREFFFWHTTRAGNATGARLYAIPPNSALPFTPQITNLALGLSTIPAPPYGSWLTGNGLDAQWCLRDLSVLDTGKWRARCTYRGWFDYVPSIPAGKLALMNAVTGGVTPSTPGDAALSVPARILIDDALDLATDADALCGAAAWTDRGTAEVVLI